MWATYPHNSQMDDSIFPPGAAKPNAQEYAFAHSIFRLLVKKMMVLRTQNFGSSYKLRTQSSTPSAAHVLIFFVFCNSRGGARNFTADPQLERPEIR